MAKGHRFLPLARHYRTAAIAIVVAFSGMAGMCLSASAGGGDSLIESALMKLVHQDREIRNVSPKNVFRYRTNRRVELVFRGHSVWTAAVAARLPTTRAPFQFSRYICSIALTRSAAVDGLALDESVPDRGLLLDAASQLSAATASISHLSVRKERRAGQWLLAVCAAPRSGIVVAKSSRTELIGRAAFEVAKSLLSTGASKQRVTNLLDLAAKAPAIHVDVSVIKDVIDWSSNEERLKDLKHWIPRMSDRDATIIAGAFLATKEKWTLSADAFAKCLEVDPQEAVCKDGLRHAEQGERKAERAAARSLFAP